MGPAVFVCGGRGVIEHLPSNGKAPGAYTEISERQDPTNGNLPQLVPDG